MISRRFTILQHLHHRFIDPRVHILAAGDLFRFYFVVLIDSVGKIDQNQIPCIDINGRLFFRMSNSYRGCLPGQEIFDYMIFTSCHTIDEYNDKFLMLSKGITTLEQFLEADKKG